MNEESLFVEALKKPTEAERRAFLEAACADNPALRQRLERLIAADLKTLGILEHQVRPAGSEQGSAGSLPVGFATGERDGTMLAGRYRLIEEIGVGGMGTVWKAEQTQPVRRFVALKLVKAGMDSRNVLARFESERQALALMEHSNIARVLDGGTTDSGRPFFVMEYVKGVPLTQYCDDARLSIAQRLALFVPVCQAVQHAHTKGVVHRDLKPSNILVCLYDGEPVPKVIDFGLAKAILEPLTQRTLFTAHGALLGTPLYMSPEQAGLNNLDVDARSDVYTLGVILYELLTGTTPLERRRFQEAAWHELIRLITEVEPPRPSARLSDSESLPGLAAQRQMQPVRLARLVRGELDWIVMKCLEKERSRRYETANSLARDLERYLAGESVEACPPSAGYRLSKFVTRHKSAVLAVSVVFVLLVAGILGTGWGLVQVSRARKAEALRAAGEILANAQAQKRLRQIEQGSEILASIFSDLDPQAEEKEGLPLRSILGDRLDQAADALEGDAIGDPLVVASLQDRLARTYRALGHPAKAKLLFAKAVALRRAELGPEHADTLALMAQQALALKDAGEVAAAIALNEHVRDAQVETLGADHPDTLSTLHNLAVAYRAVGRPNEACLLLEQVRDNRLETLGPYDDRTVDVLDDLSSAYLSVGRRDEALALSLQVRDARLKKHGPDHFLAIASLNSLAMRYRSVGRMTEALALFEQVRDSLVPRLGPEHPKSLMILDSVASMYRAFGRTEEAIPLAERILDIRVKTLGNYHPYTIHSLDNMGLAYRSAQQSEKALALFLQAAAGLEKLGFAHADGSLITANVCDALEQAGRSQEADAWRRKWLAAAKKRDGPHSVAYADELRVQGENLIGREKHTVAEPILRECLAIFQEQQAGSWKAFQAQSLLGEALMDQKKYPEAEPLLVQGYNGLEAREAEIPSLYAQHTMSTASGRIVRLYEAWRRPEKAAEWRARVSEPGETDHHP